MDIADAIREFPAVGIPFALLGVLSVCLTFAFVMQWNRFTILEKYREGITQDTQRIGRARAIVKWLLIGNFLAMKRIWDESKGMRLVPVLAVGCGVGAWALYALLKRLAAG